MKNYKVREEYLDNWGSDCYPDTIITHEDVERLAHEWEVDIDELLEQLIEVEAKNIYIATSERKDADSFDLFVTFDEQEATKTAESDWAHMTASEKKSTVNAVATYCIEVEDGETAKDAWDRILDECISVPDPIAWKVISDSEEANS